MASHSNILAWEIPRTDLAGHGPQSMGSQRVGHNLATEQRYIHLAGPNQRSSNHSVKPSGVIWVPNMLTPPLLHYSELIYMIR